MLALPACGSLGTGRVYRASVAEDCRYYDDAHLAWNAVAMAGSTLGAVGAGAGLLVDGLSDSNTADDWTTGLVITGAVGSILAVVGNWLGGQYAVRYADRCMDAEGLEAVRRYAEPAGNPPEVERVLVSGGDDLTDEELLNAVSESPVDALLGDEVDAVPAAAPEPEVEPGPGETGTGSDGLTDDATLEGDAP